MQTVERYPRFCGRCGLPKQAHIDPDLQWIPTCPEFVLGTSFRDAQIDFRIAADKFGAVVAETVRPALVKLSRLIGGRS